MIVLAGPVEEIRVVAVLTVAGSELRLWSTEEFLAAHPTLLCRPSP